jgi:hypothetical protein
MEDEYLILIEKDYEEEIKNIKLENEKLNVQKKELENKLFEIINDNNKIINKYEKKIIELNNKLNCNIIRTQPIDSNENIVLNESKNIINDTTLNENNNKYYNNNILNKIENQIFTSLYSLCSCTCLKKIKD